MATLGNLFNPYLQAQQPDFGGNSRIPKAVNDQYAKVRGNHPFAFNPSLQLPPRTRLPETMTKAGGSMNVPPVPLPRDVTNIRYPVRSSASHAIVDQPRLGVRLGAADEYRDSPYSDWTAGIQYYSIYTGENLKPQVLPVIYPQAWRPEQWAQDTVTFEQVNRLDTQDITDLSMDYSCRGCDIASASLGAPVMYDPRNPAAPLPVAAYPGEFPYVGQYTAREIGRNTRDWPQPTNPLLYMQRERVGLPNPPIQPDYDNQLLGYLRNGFDYE
jgi:hypothetical protein